MDKSKDVWQIRNVHPEVRKQIRLYAVEHNISVAQALKELTELSLVMLNSAPEYGVIQSAHFSVRGDLKAAYRALHKKFGKKKGDK